MTEKKDLKKRVRARQRKTGERYTTALAQLSMPRIAELPDASAEARAEGLRCTAIVSQALRALGDLRPLFGRVREMLEALEAEACGPLLRGESAPRVMPALRDFIEARRFLSQVRAGARGLSRDGRAFALLWSGHVVVGAVVWLPKKPMLQLGLLDDVERESEPGLSLLGIGR